MGVKEKRFLKELEQLFTGADVEGDSGFVNLMRIKRNYFRSIEPQLMKEIDERAEKDTSFREELFDKLYTFFHRYFCESGSIYFRHLPAFSKTYEQVYKDGRDVALSWKTQMLYYVKSDVLVKSMPVDLGEPEKLQFYFDASEIENKRNNEKREFVFTFDGLRKGQRKREIVLKVAYSSRGAKTNADDIIKECKKAGGGLAEERLQKAISVFKRQTEADFFINKDAKGFLCEQFDMWMYQYIFQEETDFEEKRIKQLQAIKKTAYDIIGFIAQFEDELRRVWEKPKFARNVNYVVTLDRLAEGVLKKVVKHKGAGAQIKEWQKLGMVDERFQMKDIFNGQKSLTGKNGANGGYKFLPLDTKHFKDLELEILDCLGDLDEALDGELVHSENWQALNTLLPRYKGMVKCVYIDPPYNTDASAILYRNDYKDSSWLSLMENRLMLSRDILEQLGILVVAIDDAEQSNLTILLSEIYGSDSILGTATVRSNPAGRSTAKGFSPSHEYALFVSNSADSEVGRLEHSQEQLERYNEEDELGKFEWVNFRKHGGLNSYRTARPKLFFPFYVKGEAIRLPTMTWIETKREWNIGEKPLKDEVEVWPINDKGEEKTWKWGVEKTVSNLSEFRAKNDGKDKVGIYIKSRLNIKGTLPTTWWDKKEYSASEHGTRIIANLFGDSRCFSFPKSPNLIADCLTVSSLHDEEVVLDFFAGSGTTAHAVINLNREDSGNRKYLLIEMGEYFHTVLLPRIKKVVYSKDWKEGKPASNDGASHFLKYYTLEQYEETLGKSHYEDGKQLELDSAKSPFEQYVFFGDDKLANTVKPQKNGKLKINLKGLYPDVDIAESLSNILGKPIRKLTADSVTFADGSVEKTDPAKMTAEEQRRFVSLVKPYLWWGE